MSTTTTGLPPSVEVYLTALRAELADLAPEERDDLLSEVEPSLLEAAGEGDEPIAARLGSPSGFAADLRASAGLPPAPRAEPPRTGLRTALAELADSPRVRRVLGLARELAPVWWAARTYLAVGALAVVFGIGWSAQWPMLPRFGTGTLTVIALLAVLAASCALGLATRRGRLRRASIAVNVALVVAMPFVIDAAGAPAMPVAYDDSAAIEAAPPAGLAYDGDPVENVYPYDRRGRPLYDVRLYDDLGRPLDFGRGSDDAARRQVFDERGEGVFNAYPIRYFDPGTDRVADPAAGAPPPPLPLNTKPLVPRP